MYMQNVDSVFDLEWVDGVTYGDVFHQNEVEQSHYNFELADTDDALSASSTSYERGSQAAARAG